MKTLQKTHREEQEPFNLKAKAGLSRSILNSCHFTEKVDLTFVDGFKKNPSVCSSKSGSEQETINDY